MPGKTYIDRPIPRKEGRKRGKWTVAIALALLAGWGIFQGVSGASNRFQLPPPNRALPVQADRAFEHGFQPQDLMTLMAAGQPEGVTPGGNRVRLSIDPQLQQGVYDLFRRYDPPYGVFVAMEPETGRVVSMVGYRKGGESDPSLPLKANYPAASLIKIITAAAAIEKGGVDPYRPISYRGGIYSVNTATFRAREGSGPSMSLEEAIARSANVVFGKVTVNHVGQEGLSEYLDRYGFAQSIPFDLPVEQSRALVPRSEYELARTGAGFGEVYVSPIHMAMIMASLADNGVMPRPRIIDRVENRDGATLYEAQTARWRDTVRPETSQELLRMMVKTVEMGTSRRAFGTPDRTPLLRDMEVAGKTGTLCGWTPRMHFEWFAGVAPVAGPKLAVVALVVNDWNWKIKGSYVGKEAFNAYFGYPSSLPPVYAKARGGRHVRLVSARHKKNVRLAKASRQRAGQRGKVRAGKRGKARGSVTASAAIPG